MIHSKPLAPTTNGKLKRGQAQASLFYLKRICIFTYFVFITTVFNWLVKALERVLFPFIMDLNRLSFYLYRFTQLTKFEKTKI